MTSPKTPTELQMPPAITLATLEQQKAGILADVRAWSPGRLTYRPTPTAWSATEVLDHLARVEREILNAARRGLVTPHRRGVSDQIRFAFIDWLLRSDRRVRVPDSVAEVLPVRNADLETVRREWDIARQDLGTFLTTLRPDQWRQGVFRHPVGGWMNVPQVLRFFWVHAHHHGFQLARLRQAD